ncbi:MAG TPA: cadherin-like domain-containing protein, partial [Candidatus Obscuribacterales bacterium]
VGGTFSLTTAPETAITSFTQAQLAAGVVQFVDDGDQEPPAFDVTVSDGEFESGPAPVTITDFINTNDPPTAVDDSGDGFITDEQTLFTTGSVLANDEDVDPDDVLTVVAINGQAVGAGAVTLASGAIATFAGDGTFDYDPNGKFVALIPGQSATDTFTYTVSDLAGETATATVTIEITGVNDAPTLEVNRLSISRGQTLVFSALNLFALDPDSGDEALTYTVSNVTGGQFFLDGAAATSFTQAALLAGSVSFVHDGSETAPAFEVALSDGLAALDPVATTVEQFVPVNIGAIDGGVFDYEQFVRFQNIGSVAPADEIGGLPLAQLFDEGYYLSRNADVAAAIANGALTSGYQHFSQFGYLEGRDPSVLYNEAFYLAAHSDVAAAVANGSLESGLQHFLTSGAGELRVSSPNFSQLDYLDNNADVLAAVRDGLVNSGFEHYVEFGANEPRDPRLFLYNESFYLANNADVAAAVNSGALTDGFQHFVSFGQREGRAPSILFNEDSYLLSNPDIAAAVTGGGFASGFSHYVQFGRFEDRTVFA